MTKNINKDIIIVIGGPHPSMVGTEVFKDPHIDVSVNGEGELTIIELLNSIEKHEGFSKIKGINYRYGTQVIENPPREFLEDLDSLYFPHQFASTILRDYNNYPKDAFNKIFASRGCPNNCIFCGSRNIWSRRVRFRSAMNVTNEIMSLQRMGINHVHFDDDFFGIYTKYLTQLCNSIIQNCAGLTWSCEMHVNLINEQNIALMKQAGCNLIQIGIESGNDEMLKKIRKGFTIEKAINAAHIINQYEIDLSAFFIVGFPEETENTLNDTIQAMKKINGIIVYSIFTPYPGTEAYQYCRENGLIDENYDASRYNHKSPENCFCKNFTISQFREIASEIEIFVNNHNKKILISRLLLPKNMAEYIKKYGYYYCLKRFIQLIKSVRV